MAVVGFGYVGSCLGVTLAERGFTVVGIDNDVGVIEGLRAGRSRIPEPGLAEALARLVGSSHLTFTTDYDAVRSVDVVVVTVGTPVDEAGALSTAPLEQVCHQLAPRLRRGQLVILKSTVAPGVTRTLVASLLAGSGLRPGEDFGLAYCPERLAEGAALAQLRELTVVVGGYDLASAEAAARFWRTGLNVPVHEVPSADVAEIVKLATNWWIDANIAIANELARLCAAFDVDVLEVIGAASSLPKGGGHVNILLPSVGVGGSCLTKDPWMAWRAGRDRGVTLHTIETARQVNDAMPEFSHGLIRDELVKMGRDPAAARIAILGVSFKNDTGDLRNTPVRGVVDALRAAGTEFRVYDPLADPTEVRAVLGVDPAASLAEAVAGVDAVAVLAGHRPFHGIDMEWLRDQVTMPCLVFDGRIYYPPERIERLRALGFRYRGVGR
ncbi:nucleotide sugar dehydrogenase [Nocardia transvalensis]|uniref:nucleotide sugar dehydrogenase n=1 Tax=Nocardia transvalensis TaxID=37333 RepID=UPI0018955A41|nr:nucleotide sugar dehydrogenase [Nocardia transvalensis]MBF6329817.1 nucleotide sugar dehydrogenase [Nocardia transvalensis]